MRYCPICERRFKEDTRECPVDGSVTLQIRDRGGALMGYELDGRWEVGELLREGGMGAIHVGRQLSVKRPVAIKLMRSDIMTEPRLMARFFREARALSALQHPNIVTLFDFGQDEETGLLYMVMELLRGEPLSDILDEGYPFPLSTVLYIAEQLASALIEVHDQGVIHRDLKPENIFLERVASGFHVKLIDFGVAMLDEPQLQRLTATGQLQGTPHYMAPEQINGEQASPLSDLYALGVILYEILSGRPPFIGDTLMAVLYKHLSDPPEPLHDVWALRTPPHPPLMELVGQLLAKNPADRPRDAVEVWERLGEMATDAAEYGVVAAVPGPVVPEPSPVERPPLPDPPAPLPDVWDEPPAVDLDGPGNTLERLMLARATGSRRSVIHIAVAAMLAVVGLGVLFVLTSPEEPREKPSAPEAGAVVEEAGRRERGSPQVLEPVEASVASPTPAEGSAEEVEAPVGDEASGPEKSVERKRATPHPKGATPKGRGAATHERKKLDTLLEQMRSP